MKEHRRENRKQNPWTYRLPSLGALAVLFLLPSEGLGILLCPTKWIFHLPCPACGLTRSMSSLLHLEVGKSLAFHPLGGLVLFFLLGCALTNRPDFLSRLVANHPLLSKIISWPVIIALFLIVWIVRVFVYHIQV